MSEPNVDVVDIFRDGFHHALTILRHFSGLSGSMSVDEMIKNVEECCPKPKEKK